MRKKRVFSAGGALGLSVLGALPASAVIVAPAPGRSVHGNFATFSGRDRTPTNHGLKLQSSSTTLRDRIKGLNTHDRYRFSVTGVIKGASITNKITLLASQDLARAAKITFQLTSNSPLIQIHAEASGDGSLYIAGYRLTNLTPPPAPEIDPGAGAMPAALALGSLMLMADRRSGKSKSQD